MSADEIQLFGGPADGLHLPYEPGTELFYTPDEHPDPAAERDVAVYEVVDCGCAAHEARANFTRIERRGPAPAN